MLDEAFVLAAGRSTRLAGVAKGLPKPLLPVAGEAILVRNIRWLARFGVRTVWVNLHHKGDLIRATLGEGSLWGVTIRYSDEPTIMGTAGGIRRVLSSLAQALFVVYGDNLMEFDLSALADFHRSRRADVSIAVFDSQVPNTGMAGGRVLLGDDGAVLGFWEGGDPAPQAPFVNAGVYVVERQALLAFPEGRFLDWGKHVFPALLNRGARLFGYPIDGYCLGLDTPESYERGLALIASGQVRLQ